MNGSQWYSAESKEQAVEYFLCELKTYIIYNKINSFYILQDALGHTSQQSPTCTRANETCCVILDPLGNF